MSLRPPDTEHIPSLDTRTTRRRKSPAGDPKGALVLIGGAVSPHGHALGAFLDLVGARSGGRIIGLTTASAEPAEAARDWTSTFRSIGAFNVEIPLFDHANDTLDARIAHMIREASGVFLGGGDQIKLVAAL